MARQYARDSFLRNGKSVNDWYLDINPPPKVRAVSSDEIYQIEPAYDERPDLLAHKLYGSSRLWWVFAARNPDILKDPIRDFKHGELIIIPGEQAIASITG